MSSDEIRKVQEFLFERQKAYLLVLGGENPSAKIVLDDLAKFCRAKESTFHQDPRMHAVLEGRREVWLRIEQHLKLTSEELWQTLSGRIE